MGRLSSFGLFLASLVLPAAAAPVAPSAAEMVADKYIITLKQGVSVADIPVRLGRRATSVEKVYDMPGFAGYSGQFDAAALDEIKKDSTVAAIEPVLPVYTQDMTFTADTVQEGSTWGLGSISHRTPNHTEYLYDSKAGSGTYAYVVDTGLYVDHEAFTGGKGILGYNAYPGVDFIDAHGHGTHCAGTIASAEWGVAKAANVVSVKVFHTSSSSTAIVLDGYQWAVNDIKEKGREANSVISMSLGGSKSEAFNAAVAAAYDAGITTVVAAGNSDSNASNYSPASEPKAITVGAIDIANTRAYFSNYGSILDIFAPGVDVLSSWIGAPDAVNTISGTSMATPHVSGLVLYLQSVYGITKPADIAAKIAELATQDIITDEGTGSPNLLAFNGASEY